MTMAPSAAEKIPYMDLWSGMSLLFSVAITSDQRWHRRKSRRCLRSPISLAGAVH